MENKKFLDLLNSTTETTEDHFYDMLCCLPPENLYSNTTFQAFLVGEPTTHVKNKAGKYVATFACFLAYKDKFYSLGDFPNETFNFFFLPEKKQ